MSYFRESFEYQPVKMFLNSNAADVISLPSGIIGYVSLSLTIPNANYNINTSNNTLV